MLINARESALRALSRYRKSGVDPVKTLEKIFDDGQTDEREFRLAQKIALGVLQNMLLIDYYIGVYSSVRLNRIEPVALDILRLTVYQLLFLDKVPKSAAVDEGVKLSKKHLNPRFVNFMNALPRKIAENAQNLPKIKADSAAGLLSVKYSHPQWLVSEWIGRIGEEETERLLAKNNEIPALTVHQNTLKSACADPCIILEDSAGALRSDAFSLGEFFVQDRAAYRAVAVAAPKAGDVVVDGCAAPGGKSFSAAMEMGNKGRVIACDSAAVKLPLIEDGAKRLGITIIETREMDGAQPDRDILGVADVVLADVPCSGFGVIRKKPEIRYKTQDTIAGLPALQLSVLTGLSKCVKPGGVLLYSTCTLLKRENEDVAEAFLRDNPVFSLEGEMTTLWPQIDNTDGFFICKMRKTP